VTNKRRGLGLVTRICLLLDRLQQQRNKLRGLKSASELYGLTTATCRRNLVTIFVDRRVSRGQRGGSPTVVNLSFLYRSRYFSFE
jgi:hypothetical protein